MSQLSPWQSPRKYYRLDPEHTSSSRPTDTELTVIIMNTGAWVKDGWFKSLTGSSSSVNAWLRSEHSSNAALSGVTRSSECASGCPLLLISQILITTRTRAYNYSRCRHFMGRVAHHIRCIRDVHRIFPGGGGNIFLGGEVAFTKMFPHLQKMWKRGTFFCHF